MGIVTIIAIWLGLGAVGSILVLEFMFRRSRSLPMDIDIGLIMIGAVFMLAGPANFLVGVFCTAVWFFTGVVNTDRVIFPAKD